MIVFILLAALSGCKLSEKKWLFVVHSRSSEITAKTLVMRDIDEYAIAFTERPVREKSALPVIQLINEWPILFSTSSPNATIAFYDRNKKYHEVIVVLNDPVLVGDELHIQITPLFTNEIVINQQLDETMLFIDDVIIKLDNKLESYLERNKTH